MNCLEHTEVPGHDRCAACAEIFCKDCLVELAGIAYCDACKSHPLSDPPQFPSRMRKAQDVNKAIGTSIAALTIGMLIGIVGIGCGIGAINLGNSVLKECRQNPNVTGWGVGLAAIFVHKRTLATNGFVRPTQLGLPFHFF